MSELDRCSCSNPNQGINSCCFHLLRLLFETDDDEELLCQFLFLWLMNQLFICFNCKPVSCTSFTLSSSVGYGHLACDCHQAFRTDVVSPGSFPALLLRKISSLISTIFSLYPCFNSCFNSCLTRSINDRSVSVGMRGPNPMLSGPSKPPSNRVASLSIGSSSSSDIVAPVP